jgi:TfoX/Sxy family transcriptional regulator of competence genes
MASRQSTVDGLLERLAGAGRVTARKMFGEYCVYLDGKPVALVCDDRLYLKPTEAGRELMPDAEEEPPYPGAKPHLVITPDRWADEESLCRLVRATFAALPRPRKSKRKPGPK